MAFFYGNPRIQFVPVDRIIIVEPCITCERNARMTNSFYCKSCYFHQMCTLCKNNQREFNSSYCRHCTKRMCAMCTICGTNVQSFGSTLCTKCEQQRQWIRSNMSYSTPLYKSSKCVDCGVNDMDHGEYCRYCINKRQNNYVQSPKQTVPQPQNVTINIYNFNSKPNNELPCVQCGCKLRSGNSEFCSRDCAGVMYKEFKP